jgi:hypothetical protein
MPNPTSFRLIFRLEKTSRAEEDFFGNQAARITIPFVAVAPG